MGLRETAAADLKLIVENTDDFGWPITVTPPDGPTVPLVGLSTDIAQTIDPETGQAVAGRTASVALAIASLEAAGLGMPRGVADKGSMPWRIEFNDIGGKSHLFKVTEALPDRALGCVVCILEAYKLAATAP